jgi:purine-binding chemotaxis protein CheW
MAETATAASTAQYLTFCIDEEEYAVGILRVREIIQYEAITRVPSTPPWIRGVMNLRGSVVPVVDLAAKFGISPRPLLPTTCIVILEVSLDGQQNVMGVLADSVDQVIDLPASDIQPPPAFGTRIRVDFLSGMAALGKKFALILNIDHLLSTNELLVAQTLAASAGDQLAAPETPALASAGA